MLVTVAEGLLFWVWWIFFVLGAPCGIENREGVRGCSGGSMWEYSSAEPVSTASSRFFVFVVLLLVPKPVREEGETRGTGSVWLVR